MKYFSANGWQALLYALIAGVKAGALLMAATGLRRHLRPWLSRITDSLCGVGMVALLGQCLWQGTEGSFHPYMAAAMLLGMGLFRWGPQAALEAVIRRIRR